MIWGHSVREDKTEYFDKKYSIQYEEAGKMGVHPQVQAVLSRLAELNFPSIETAPLSEIREAFSYSRTQMKEVIAPVASIEDRTLVSPDTEIPIRIYTPEGPGPHPVLVFFHGGGFVLGDLDTTHNICRYLAWSANCVVVSVDYRLAPEHKFPAAMEDAYFATKWVAENAASFGGDATRIAVGGESAGGNLAAVVSLLARDGGGPAIIYQLLIYPAVYFGLDSQSCIECGNKYNLTVDEMVWFRDHYLNGPDDEKNPLVAPLLASDLSGLPPALVVTAEFDPIRDDGEAYAARLVEHGVKATAIRYEGMVHTFLNFSGEVDQSKTALDEIAAGLRNAFLPGEK